MIYHFDIDNTICKSKGDYIDARPIKKRIKEVNRLYDEGHMIVFYSGRGVGTGKNLMPLTVKQFKKWGLKYHQIKLTKEPFDLLVDDKAINADEFFRT